MRGVPAVLLLLVGALGLAAPGHTQDQPPRLDEKAWEIEPIESSSAEFLASADAALRAVDEQFREELDYGSLAAVADPYNLVPPDPLPSFGPGESGTTYHVVLQPGHFGRSTGMTGSVLKQRVGGRDVEVFTEKTLVAYVVSVTAAAMAEQGYKVVVIPADGYRRPLESDIFLSVHADGTENNNGCSDKGPSLGYDSDSDLLGMHSMGFALNAAMGYQPDEWHDPNFTANLRGYYAFSDMTTGIFEGVLELGEVSCASKAAVLATNADGIGRNIAKALAYSLDLHGKTP